MTRAVFDHQALMGALDRRRAEEGLNWPELATVLHDQSAELNARLQGPCMCSGALVRTAKRTSGMSCQYAVILLRWLGRPPEDFLTAPSADVGDTRLPDADTHARLRWDLPQLYAALNLRRQHRRLTWAHVGAELGCTPARLTNLRTARLAEMDLAMGVTQWLGEPAAAFIHPVEW